MRASLPVAPAGLLSLALLISLGSPVRPCRATEADPQPASAPASASAPGAAGNVPLSAIDGITAIAATPFGTGLPGNVLAFFGAELPIALRRAGFSLLDPRQVDVKLADRPDLLQSCQNKTCLLDQAQLLGAAHLIVPHLRIDKARLVIELVMYNASTGKSPSDREGRSTAVIDLIEAARAQESCETVDMPVAIAAVVAALREAADQGTAAHLSVSARPRSAHIFIDGIESGTGQVERALPPGEHRVEARGPAGNAEKQVDLAPRQKATLELSAGIEPVAPPPKTRPLAVAKWVTLGAGLAAVAAGVTLWVLDGKGVCTLTGSQAQCPQVLDTRNAGIGVLTGGAVLVGASGLMFGLDARHSHESGSAATLTLAGAF